MPHRVSITESSPRDGLQSVGAMVPTEAKVTLIDDLARAGLVSFDAVSFVSPEAVPQMADAAQVMAGVRREGIVMNGLVPNLKGLAAALDAGVDGIAVLTAASDTFNQRNVNATVDEAMGRIRAIVAETPPGVGIRGYVSTATHCPYEGRIDPDRVAGIVSTLLEAGVAEVFLGDTVGRATPAHVERLLGAVLETAPVDRVGVHFHDTYGQGVANVATALATGIDRLDSSAGGLGGCPYAPGAAGNVATEDVIWLLDGLGIEHGVDLLAVARTARAFCDAHGLEHRSDAGRAITAEDRA
jgi:hydroxymethylglutaryl-CoA lyase